MAVAVTSLGSVCINDVNFTTFVTDVISEDPIRRQEITQFQAIEDCAQLNSLNLTLGPILNISEFSGVVEFLESNDQLFTFDPDLVDHQIGFYVGLQAFQGQQVDGGDTLDFSFVSSQVESIDEFSLDFYHVQLGNFPWGINQPDNFENDQNCAQLSFFRDEANELGRLFNGVLDDIRCDGSNGFICRGPCLPEDLDIADEAEKDDLNVGIICGITFLFVSLTVSVVLHQRARKQQSHLKLRVKTLSKF